MTGATIRLVITITITAVEGDKMKKIMSFLLVLAILFSCQVAQAITDLIPAYVKILDGFTYLGRANGDVFMTKGSTSVSVRFNNRGNFQHTLLMWNEKTSKTKDILNGFVANYSVMRIQLGKDFTDYPAMTRKVKCQLDTVMANLKLNENTSFMFDDIMVTARREGMKDDYIVLLSYPSGP